MGQLFDRIDAGRPASLPEVPRRRHRLVLDLEADSIDDLVAALHGISFDLQARGGKISVCTSGGVSSGFHLEHSVRSDIDHDGYIAALKRFAGASS